MGLEIERKFLVVNDSWRTRARQPVEIAQGYLGEGSKASVRIRVAGEQAWLCVKSARSGMTRLEFEYPVPVEDGRTMLRQLTRDGLVEKTRFSVPENSHTWELDVFHGANDGLVIAELELERESEAFHRPEWLGLEVTDDARFYNGYLAKNPYSQWDAHTEGP
jgi:adenylate cyclase